MQQKCCLSQFTRLVVALAKAPVQRGLLRGGSEYQIGKSNSFPPALGVAFRPATAALGEGKPVLAGFGSKTLVFKGLGAIFTSANGIFRPANVIFQLANGICKLAFVVC